MGSEDFDHRCHQGRRNGSFGKVAEAQFDLEKGAPAYEISIIAADGTEHDFMVDANTGKVEKLAANEDQNGAEENGENGESEEGENG
ncbi:MAG: PepSY domain-containing protein [Nitratireductor sp.]